MKKKIIFTITAIIWSAQSFAESPYNTMQTWIMLGDSIMSAVSPIAADGNSGKANQLTSHLLMNDRNISIRNLSSPGASYSHKDYTGFGDTASVLSSIDRIGGAFGYYNGLIIQVGTNDFGRDIPPNNVAESLRGILNHAEKNKKKVMVMEPIWRRNELVKNKLGFDLNTYRDSISMVCTKEFPNTCHYARRSNSKLSNYTSSMYFDGNEIKSKSELHLNANGHRIYADWIEYEASIKKWF